MVFLEILMLDKSIEIAAIPELLMILDASGCIVTQDATDCQKEITEQIVDVDSEFVLVVKANQGKLHENTEDVFNITERNGFGDVPHSYHEQVNKGHGRLCRGVPTYLPLSIR